MEKLKNNWVAVLGGSVIYTDDQIFAAYQIGREIVKNGYNLITGATSGIPYAAAIGAKEAGGLVVGISPAKDFDEHLSVFNKPIEYLDLIIYGNSVYEGRSPLIIHSASASIFIGGEMGTLNEFTSAWMTKNNIIGILEGYGGITDYLPTIIENTNTSYGCITIQDKDPFILVKKIGNEIKKRNNLISNNPGVKNRELDIIAIINKKLDRSNE